MTGNDKPQQLPEGPEALQGATRGGPSGRPSHRQRLIPKEKLSRLFELPQALEKAAAQRVGVVALGMAGLFLLGYIQRRLGFIFGASFSPRVMAILEPASFAWFALSLGLAFYAFLSKHPRRVFALSIVYEVFVCFSLAALEELSLDFLSPPSRLSYLALTIFAFAVVVPTPPKVRASVIGLCLCAQVLGAFGMARIHEGRWPHAVAFLSFAPTWMGAALALGLSRVIHKLRLEAGAAQLFGSYRLKELIAAGSMGEIWRASHRFLVRPAAVKIVAQNSAIEESETRVRQRFVREAQATAVLRSVHTVEIYDFGVTDENRFFYAMELLDGLNLEELIKDFGPQPPSRVVHLLKQACSSLGDAHAHGLVHRDIKPANLFLTCLGDAYDFIKVLDFGLVKPRRRFSAASWQTTEGRAVVGTPAFISPEAAVSGDVDGRSDLYSLGAVAYWLLSGTLVFSGGSATGIILKHIHDTPEPPSKRLGRPLPPELEALVLRCLEKNPSHRPTSASDLKAQLEALPLARWSQEEASLWWDQYNTREPLQASQTRRKGHEDIEQTLPNTVRTVVSRHVSP